MSKLDYSKIRKTGAVLGGRVPVSTHTDKLPVIMPFGKYKDLPISELPVEYVYWLIDRLNEKPTDDSGLYLALVERIS